MTYKRKGLNARVANLTRGRRRWLERRDAVAQGRLLSSEALPASPVRGMTQQPHPASTLLTHPQPLDVYGPATTVPSTSGVAVPSTSTAVAGVAVPSTSGVAVPSTSGVAVPSTSGVAVPSTSTAVAGVAVPSTSGGMCMELAHLAQWMPICKGANYERNRLMTHSTTGGRTLILFYSGCDAETWTSCSSFYNHFINKFINKLNNFYETRNMPP
ncbi:uncharacterized protein [Procambarus clarkii]|uniref:uncharacterized protein n=1 Tax=Procambarus clarkii TaxID=6728 RepID=UPI003741F5C2